MTPSWRHCVMVHYLTACNVYPWKYAHVVFVLFRSDDIIGSQFIWLFTYIFLGLALGRRLPWGNDCQSANEIKLKYIGEDDRYQSATKR